MFKEVGRPMFFRGDGKVHARAQDGELIGTEFETARSTRIRPDRPSHGKGRLLCEGLERLPRCVADFLAGKHGLEVTGAIAHDEEGNLATRPGFHYPPADRGAFTNV
jgi:hypothetical protein